MKNPLISYFNSYLELNAEEINFLDKNVPIINIEGHHHLLESGETASAFYFVIEGIIRMYYLVDGVEKTTFFYKENDFVSSYESFTKQTPAEHYLQTVEKSKIAVIEDTVVTEIIGKFPRMEMLARIIMERELIVYQDILASFITMNAEQRYVELMKKEPQLWQRIPQYHIATYLGVSPETLSRIKNRIRKKGFS